MTEKTEALRLADSLRDGVPYDEAEIENELRRLHTDAEESEALRERLSALLRNTAIALRGPEPELTRWSWHDLPDLAAALKAELRRLSIENERLHQINQSHEMKLSVRGYEIQIADLEAQRDALLEALKLARPYINTYALDGYHAEVKADAAIKAVEGEKT